MKRSLACLMFHLSGMVAWAAELEETTGTSVEEGNSVVNLLVGLLPIAFIMFFALWIAGRKNNPYMRRAVAHMDKVEQQNEEIIRLLKSQQNREE